MELKPSSLDRTRFAIIGITGGPDTYLFGRFSRRLSHLFEQIGKPLYCLYVDDYCFFQHIGGSILDVDEEGILRTRLTRDGCVTCTIAVPRQAWIDMDEPELKQYYANLLWAATEQMAKRVVKTKHEFDSERFLTDTRWVLETFLAEK